MMKAMRVLSLILLFIMMMPTPGCLTLPDSGEIVETLNAATEPPPIPSYTPGSTLTEIAEDTATAEATQGTEEPGGTDAAETEQPEATPSGTPTRAPSPSNTPSPTEPEETAEPSPTPTATRTAAPAASPSNWLEFTPTMVSAGGTPPIEVTPLGGEHLPDGGGGKPDGNLPDGAMYVTSANLNLRSAPEVKAGNVLRVLPAGVYPAYDLIETGADDWVRICQPGEVPPCGYLAQFVGDRKWGDIVYPPPILFSLFDSITASEIGGGGSLEMEFNPSILWALLLTLAGMVPVLGGSVGLVVGLIVDVIKGVLLWREKELPPEWGGILAIIFNAVIWVGLFILLRTAPADSLPEDVDQWFKIAATALTFALTFLAQLKAAGFSHGVLKSKAPMLFSVSENKRVQILKERGVDPEVAELSAAG